MGPTRVSGVRDGVDAALLRGAETRKQTFDSLPPKLAVGDTLGPFRIVKDIQRGTNAAVYEATDGDRNVALKVLGAQLSVDDAALERFHAEISIAERVSHPSLLPIYAAGEDRGHHYFAMRLESGRTLRDLVGDESSDESYYVYLAREFSRVASLLSTLHQNGIVHRDVKPSNILLDRDGSFVLCDFGSALDANHRIAQLEKNPGGTVLYMSPEQLRPGCDPYDTSCDIYSLGATLYELCTGRTPFPLVPEDELALLKYKQIPMKPDRVNHHIPLALDAIIGRAMHGNPSERYLTMELFARHLERFASRKESIKGRR